MNRVIDIPRTWTELNALHELRPLRTAKQYDRAVAVMSKLAVLLKPTTDQSDYLDTLSVLIEEYDRIHCPWAMEEIDPLDALKFLMEEHGWTGSDLGRFLGNRSQGSLILRGERELSKANMIALGEHFKVNPGLFLGPSKPRKQPKRTTARAAQPRTA